MPRHAWSGCRSADPRRLWSSLRKASKHEPIDEALALANGGIAASIDMEVEIARLAALDMLTYETERTAVAGRLGLRVSVLDEHVEKARA